MRPDRAPDAVEAFNAAWMLPTDVDGRPQWLYQQARPQPLRVSLMERHHHVAQAFVPVTRAPYIMVVAAPNSVGKGVLPDLETVRAFYVDGSVGLIINRGTWHALDRLPVGPEPLEFFFATEAETQEDMAAHAATHPERLVRSDIVKLGDELVLVDPEALLPPGAA